jgi:hypothetical protein
VGEDAQHVALGEPARDRRRAQGAVHVAGWGSLASARASAILRRTPRAPEPAASTSQDTAPGPRARNSTSAALPARGVRSPPRSAADSALGGSTASPESSGHGGRPRPAHVLRQR